MQFMNSTLKNIRLQYQGYLNTPLLWRNHVVFNLKQLKLPKVNAINFNEGIPDNLILGKRVERFVHAELEKHKRIKILLKNTQIIHKKTTIGEIDCVLMKDDIPIHLEIIYKFYLYDSSMGDTEIEHWIGPNRKDSLVQKLNKLKDKQLPLINNVNTLPILNKIDVDVRQLQQRVCFKAQLFTPFKANINFGILNRDCLAGFYIHISDIDQFSDCKFHIPIKINWLMDVQAQVDWLDYQSFYSEILLILNKKRAPLCWIKFPNESLQKFFIVWWK